MNFKSTADMVDYIKRNFQIGDLVMVDHMTDIFNPCPDGSVCEVTGVDDIGTIHVKWAFGVHACTGLIFGEDKFENISADPRKLVISY